MQLPTCTISKIVKKSKEFINLTLKKEEENIEFNVNLCDVTGIEGITICLVLINFQSSSQNKIHCISFGLINSTRKSELVVRCCGLKDLQR